MLFNAFFLLMHKNRTLYLETSCWVRWWLGVVSWCCCCCADCWPTACWGGESGCEEVRWRRASQQRMSYLTRYLSKLNWVITCGGSVLNTCFHKLDTGSTPCRGALHIQSLSIFLFHFLIAVPPPPGSFRSNSSSTDLPGAIRDYLLLRRGEKGRKANKKADADVTVAS